MQGKIRHAGSLIAEMNGIFRKTHCIRKAAFFIPVIAEG